MNRSAKTIVALAAVAVIAQAIPTMANSGLNGKSVASDTPYRQSAATSPVASSSGKKFQIAPVKTQPATSVAAADSASKPMAHPHWR
jgi:hypothetical protein